MTPEQECSQTTSQRLPDTCPISQTELSPPNWNSQERQEPWGRLYPTMSEFQCLELVKDEYTVGRGPTCDLSLNLEPNNTRRDVSSLFGAISKVHFRIRRIQISSSDIHDYIVYLDDLSSNGTFVDGKKIGRGNSVILENNNEISFCFSYYKVFIYISASLDSEVRTYPENVKNMYAISRVLGSGAFGQVRLVFDKTFGKALAMKVIQKKRLGNSCRHLYDPVRTQREVDILKALSHPFVIQFENVFDSQNHMFILTEYMDGGELYDKVKNGPLPESEAKLYFFQLALAVRYLHANGIIHRDIKLENILLTTRGQETVIKLSDFGFSKFLGDEAVMMTYCGTPLYIAPEILKNKGNPGSYDTKVDVWSMGVVLFICLSGVPPFDASAGHGLTEQILKCNYSFSHRQWSKVSRKAVYIVRRMLTVPAEERLSTDQVLNHMWLEDKSVSMRVNRILRNSSGTGPSELTSNERQKDKDDADAVDSDVENDRRTKRARRDD